MPRSRIFLLLPSKSLPSAQKHDLNQMLMRLQSVSAIVVFKGSAIKESDLAAQSWMGGVIVGAALARRILRPLRERLPEKTLIVFLPEVGSLLPAKAPGLESWSKIFSRADAVWTARFEDLAAIVRTLGPIRSALSTVPRSRLLWPQRRLTKRKQPNRTAPKPLGDGTVGALNKALRRSSGPFRLLSLHPVRLEPELWETLENLLRRLPQAGGVVPMISADVVSVQGNLGKLDSGQLAATWALRQKGSSCECRILGHACLALLRDTAVKAAGFFDERFHLPGFAWLDYSLRLRHLGFPVFIAQDFLLDCAREPMEHGAEDDRALLVEKWVRGSLEYSESIFTASEPASYRIHPETHIASGGLERS